jgi:hypothetical protein
MSEMIPMPKAALEQLRTTIHLQQQDIYSLVKRANALSSAVKQGTTAKSASLRVVAADLVDTLVAQGSVPAVSRTNIMEKLAADHSAALESFLAYVSTTPAAKYPPAMGVVDKSAAVQTSAGGAWGEAGSAFENAMGL